MENDFLQIRKDCIIVKLHHDLDHHLTEEIRDSIDESIDKFKPRCLIFDFRNVNFMDSSGIGLIMGRYKRIHMIGGTVYVTNLGSNVQRIFSLSGLYKITEQIEDAGSYATTGKGGR